MEIRDMIKHSLLTILTNMFNTFALNIMPFVVT